MKFINTQLWKQLSQVNLENLLFIATDRDYDFFVDELKKNNNMRIDVCSILY